MSNLTSLKGKRITVPAGWTVTRGYGKYNITGNIVMKRIVGRFYEYEGVTLSLGFNQGGTATADSIRYFVLLGDGIEYKLAFSPTDEIIIDVTGGVDADNESLIQWVIDNNAIIRESIKFKSPVAVLDKKAKVVIDNVNMTIDIYTKEIPSGMQLSVTINPLWLDGVNDVTLCFNIPSGIELNTSTFQDIFNIVGDKWYDTTGSNYLFLFYYSYTDEYYLNVYYSVNNTEYGVNSSSSSVGGSIHNTTTLTKLDYYCPYSDSGSND